MWSTLSPSFLDTRTHCINRESQTILQLRGCFYLLFASILNYVLIFFISTLCTIMISIVITGSCHIDTVCVIRWKFFKWSKNDDNNTDWSWSIRSSHQWYSRVISIQLESHSRNMSISLPFLLIQHNFMYLWVSLLAPRKSTHNIQIEIFERQIQFLFLKRCIELFLMKRRCGQSVVSVPDVITQVTAFIPWQDETW
jgi:hypothetical protein